MLERAFVAGETGDLAVAIPGRDDGAARWLQVRFVPVRDGAETVAAMLIGTDITDRKHAERERAALEEEVESACDGREAVAYCSDGISGLDLVILDLAMPAMDGRECFYRLKELDPGVKVVIASGHALGSTGQELLDAGALRFLPKPFTPDQLVEAVGTALGTGS